MTQADFEKSRSESRSLVVIGLGYVGLPLAATAAAAGYKVVGLDQSPRVVQALNNGTSLIDDISDKVVGSMLDSGFYATTDEAVLARANVVVICVPTPLSVEGNPDLTAVTSAGAAIATHLTRGTLVILESTTFPGTTEEILAPVLARSGLTPGVDFSLAFSPERVDPGNKKFTIRNTPKVVGGVTEQCTREAAKFYEQFVETVVRARGVREAETAKLLENTYRHINIALVNEMARVCHELDIDIWDVVRCASTKPFGFQTFYPGPGVGGHCIPIDPNYLAYTVKVRLGYPMRFVELATEINSTMPSYVASRVQEMLNDRCLAVNGAKILLIGVTYKPDIADVRESPARDVAKRLAELGADLRYTDPYVDEWVLSNHMIAPADLTDPQSTFQVGVILQHHSSIDLGAIKDRCEMVLDTRGILSGPNVETL